MDTISTLITDSGLEVRHQIIEEGETIISPLTSETNLYYIKKGFVREFVMNKAGERTHSLFYKAGDLFPLSLLENLPHTENYYQSITEIEVVKIKKSVLVHEMKHNIPLMNAIMHKANELTELYRLRLQDVLIKNKEKRIISRMLFLIDRFGVKREENIRIDIPLSQEDLASSVGMSMDSFRYTFKKLKAKRLIACVNGYFVVAALERLTEQLL